MEIRFFTSESVTEGHPDKMCDRISDAILDGFLTEDPETRMGCETTATTGLIHVMGECSSKAVVDIEKVVRQTVADVGYDNGAYGFDAKTCAVLISLHGQSGDISQGVLHALEARAGASEAGFQLGAGDQGMMFGYACDQTEDYMPLPIFLAHRLTQRLARVRKEKILDYLRPDGKSQVTVQYENGLPVRVDTIVIAAPHSPAVTQSRIHRDIVLRVGGAYGSAYNLSAVMPKVSLTVSLKMRMGASKGSSPSTTSNAASTTCSILARSSSLMLMSPLWAS